MFADFLIFLVGALFFDRVGFSQLKNTAGMFRSVEDSFTYRSVAFPRLVILPVAAALFAYSRHANAGSTVAAIAGIALGLGVLMVPWCRFLRSRL